VLLENKYGDLIGDQNHGSKPFRFERKVDPNLLAMREFQRFSFLSVTFCMALIVGVLKPVVRTIEVLHV